MNNFNNVLTKTESLRTFTGGLQNSESGEGEDLLDTCKLYITEISSKKMQNFTEKLVGRDLRRPTLN